MRRQVGGRIGSVARRLGATHQAPAALTIELDYPVVPTSRHGWGKPPHPELATIIGAASDRYASSLVEFAQLADPLSRISVEWVDEPHPYWNNNWFQGLDVVALYGHLALRNPRVCVEIGSGYSTRVARRAIQDHQLRTRIVSIDPHPRSPVAAVVDEHRAQGLEAVDLAIFDTLARGDVVLFDGSHRALTNSDVTVLFTEVLPRLPPGVLVQVHDIFLPWDYRPDWADRWYSEQYLLAAWLLGGDRLEVVMPSFYVSLEPALETLLSPIWARFPTGSVNRDCPSSFWFELRGDPRAPEPPGH